MKFAAWANSSLLQQTITIFAANLVQALVTPLHSILHYVALYGYTAVY